MKKFVATVVCVVALAGSFNGTVQAAEKGGAGPAIASFFLPGVGEWMNNDYKGSYPFGECLVGCICFPFMISSVIDAAKGQTDTEMRFDFWSSSK